MDLSIDNKLTDSQIENLFLGGNDEPDTEDSNENNEEANEDKENKEDTTEVEVDADSLFEPESVGSEKEKYIEKKEDSDEKGKGSSPDNFYSSIANALVEDGVLLNLDKKALSEITDANSLKRVIQAQISNSLTEQQKRISDALNNNVDVSDIRKYENTINYLNNIKDSDIIREGEDGAKLRRQLIYQDLANRGYSENKIEREIKKSFDLGTDIDDAKEALESNKKFFTSQYNDILNDAKEEESERNESMKKQAEDFRKSIMNDTTVLGGISISEDTKKQIYDNVTNPKYRDADGNQMTELQKYETENKEKFLKIVSTIFTLTNGFEDFGKLSKQAVNKATKKGLAALENTINNTSRSVDGSLRFASGVSDKDSYFSSFDFDL